MQSDVSHKVQKYFSSFPVRTYEKGQILIFAGENPEHVFYIVEGKVRVYDVSYRGDEVVANVFAARAFFPMSWVINKTPNKYFYKTEVETTVHVVPIDDALAFIHDNPDVLFDLLRRVYAGVDGLQGRMMQLMAGSAKTRLVYEILIESRRFGKTQPDGAIQITLSEVDLAARAGLSRETVSREMRKLKNEGRVRITPKAMYVKSIAELEQILGEEPVDS
jgi:CRP-like cAMP-binding protein